MPTGDFTYYKCPCEHCVKYRWPIGNPVTMPMYHTTFTPIPLAAWQCPGCLTWYNQAQTNCGCQSKKVE